MTVAKRNLTRRANGPGVVGRAVRPKPPVTTSRSRSARWDTTPYPTTTARLPGRGRVAIILRQLRTAYPDAHCALHHQTPLQLLVATILSAQCTDQRVNQVTPALFAAYRTAADFAGARPRALQAIIRSTGFFRNKARAIRNCCRAIATRYGGRVPDRLEDLLPLDGIGRKTANVVLGVAYGRAEGIVVDTHVARLSRRLGLTRAATPEKIERALMPIVPRTDWIDFSHLLIWHGRRRCMARKPDCARCELLEWCPRIGVARKEKPT